MTSQPGFLTVSMVTGLPWMIEIGEQVTLQPGYELRPGFHFHDTACFASYLKAWCQLLRCCQMKDGVDLNVNFRFTSSFD